jgi:hypothetical protein
LTGALSKHDFSEIPGLNISLQKFAQNSFLNENSRNLRPNDRIQVSFLFQKESFETELWGEINYLISEGLFPNTGFITFFKFFLYQWFLVHPPQSIVWNQRYMHTIGVQNWGLERKGTKFERERNGKLRWNLPLWKA